MASVTTRTPSARMSALSRAILHYLEVNGPSTASEIKVAVVQQQHSAELVRPYLVNLRGLGYVVRQGGTAPRGEMKPTQVWKLAPTTHVADAESKRRAKPKPVEQALPAVAPAADPVPPVPCAPEIARPALREGEVAKPRRIDVMSGEPYRPTPVVLRAGALDFAALPSLHFGTPRVPGSRSS